MRDFQRLRAQLRAALLCAPLALAGCGGKGGDTTTTGNGEEPELGNESTETTPAVRETAWPTSAGHCESGQWCGPVSQASEQAGTSAANGCPESFARDQVSFSLDPSGTEAAHTGGDPNSCCYYWSAGGECWIEGRPLVDGGQARVAPVREGGAWSKGALPPAPELPATLRAAIARGWLDDALVEHASVASFARATLELMAVGAPPELLADCQRAGLDEVRHAEGCFALAERYGGRRVAPGPITSPAAREASLTRLAVDTFFEGCVAETIATLGASRALASCTDPEVSRLLVRVVRDETRHAALAWRTVAWAIREGGAPVKDALRAVAVAPRELPAAAADPVLRAHGRLDDATKRGAVLDAWREIIAPTLAELLA